MNDKQVIFILAGRLGKSLVNSKVIPFVELDIFRKILIFSEEPGLEVTGVTYITLPSIIRKCRIPYLKKVCRILYEPIQAIAYALRERPGYINGIYTNPKGLNSWIASVFSRSKCIISIIGGIAEIETSFYHRKISIALNLFLLRNCYRVFTKGINDNDYLVNNGIPEEKIIVYNGAVDLKRFRNTGCRRDIDIVFVGHFDNNKGPDRFIEICKLLANSGLRFSAVMLGEGPLFNSIAGQLKEDDNLKYISLAGSRDDVELFFQRSRVMILPSKSEGLSTAMLEAMACGCVPVVTNTGNNGDAAINGFNSFLIDNYADLDLFAQSVKKLLNDEQLWKRLSENAQATIPQKYSPSAQAEILKDLFL